MKQLMLFFGLFILLSCNDNFLDYQIEKNNETLDSIINYIVYTDNRYNAKNIRVFYYDKNNEKNYYKVLFFEDIYKRLISNAKYYKSNDDTINNIIDIEIYDTSWNIINNKYKFQINSKLPILYNKYYYDDNNIYKICSSNDNVEYKIKDNDVLFVPQYSSIEEYDSNNNVKLITYTNSSSRKYKYEYNYNYDLTLMDITAPLEYKKEYKNKIISIKCYTSLKNENWILCDSIIFYYTKK